MMVRDYKSSDLPRLKELFASRGFEYTLPDFETGEFVVRRVITDDDGQIVNAVMGRKTVELFLLADGGWRTPRWRFEALRIIHEDVRSQLARLGYKDAHVWLPPTICKAFGRRLQKFFNWNPNPWPCYSRTTELI